MKQKTPKVHMADMASIGSKRGRTACGIMFYPIHFENANWKVESSWELVTCKDCLKVKNGRWK